MAFSWDLYHQMPLVAILRGFSAEETEGIIDAAAQAGLTTMEITMNTLGVEEMIKKAASKYHGRMNIGAGTVCNLDDLQKAVDAGATFIVTPITDQEVINACKSLQLPIFCGAFTPTEVYKAWEAGADMVKLFPAEFLGPAYAKSILAPLNNISLVPTGGVGPDNMGAYWKIGVKGFGMGSKLLDKNLIKQRDWLGLKKHFEGLCSLFEDIRQHG